MNQLSLKRYFLQLLKKQNSFGYLEIGIYLVLGLPSPKRSLATRRQVLEIWNLHRFFLIKFE